MTASRHDRLAAARLYLIATLPPGMDPLSPPAFWWTALEAAVRGGAALVQLRAKGLGTDELLRLLVRMRSRLGDEVLLIVNDDLRAGMADEADGVHLGREDLELAEQDAGLDPASATPSPALEAVRRQAGPLLDLLRGMGREALARRVEGLHRARAALGQDRLLGTSTRSWDEVQLAMAGDADHVGFGAMAASGTKRGAALADPLELARTVSAAPRYPIFPIGGLGPHNLDLVREAGVGRAAVGSALLDADDPWALAAELVRRLATAREPFRPERDPDDETRRAGG